MKYRKWAKSVHFLSKLPGDVRKCKEEASELARTLDGDLRERVPERVIAPYSATLFHRKAIEWMVATDQVSGHILTNVLL